MSVGAGQSTEETNTLEKEHPAERVFGDKKDKKRR